MSEDIINQVKASIERARNWPTEGWKVQFGPARVAVCSLVQAQEMPREFAHREEAVGYWKNVELISVDVTKYLEMALAALEKGDMKVAGDKLYTAQYLEKPLASSANTSRPVYESFMARSA